MKLIVKNVYKSFGEKKIIQNASYCIDKPGIIKIDGVSGSGKTTLLKIIAGLEKQDSGEVITEGKVVYMFQEPRLFPKATLIDNVCFGRHGDREKALACLEKVGLAGEARTRAENASGGMQQRTAFARMLLAAEDAEILLLDEPYSAQDIGNAEAMREMVKTLAKTKIVVLVSHIDFVL